jgi:hypothetical protein
MSEELSNEEENELFEYLLEVGALEIDGVASDGEIMFKVNTEKMKEYCPDMLEVMHEDLESSLLDLYEKGLVNMQYNEDLEAIFDISPEGEKALLEMGFYNLDGLEEK